MNSNIRYINFILQSTLDDLKRNKLRTVLTSLGILIGISSVVLLLAFGLGLKKYIEDQFNSLGTNLIMVMPGKILQGGFNASSMMMSGGKFDDKDAVILKRVKNISLVAPAFVKFTTIKGDTDSKEYEVIAGTPEIFTILNFEIDKGTMFNRGDNDRRKKVAVLGSKPAEKLFGSADNALNKIAKISDQGYKVIGVLKSKGGGGFGGPGMDDHIFIPFKAASSFNPSKKYFSIYAKTEDGNLLAQTKEEMHKALLKKYNEDDFSVLDQKEVMDTLSAIFNVLNFVLVGIAAISLVVGGIGVMNIMYVSVVERVREIGIRRAFGAREKDILYLFLSEAVVLSLFGGLLGLSISFLVVAAVQKIFPAYINFASVAIALGVSSAIGIIFGVFPAKRAANLTPVEAIRYE